ncbi:hypothetical protein N9I68_04815 [Bacteroidia bacterium]|nr:hypothetical protein [Bacteroidia bacterium]
MNAKNKFQLRNKNIGVADTITLYTDNTRHSVLKKKSKTVSLRRWDFLSCAIMNIRFISLRD